MILICIFTYLVYLSLTDTLWYTFEQSQSFSDNVIEILSIDIFIDSTFVVIYVLYFYRFMSNVLTFLSINVQGASGCHRILNNLEEILNKAEKYWNIQSWIFWLSGYQILNVIWHEILNNMSILWNIEYTTFSCIFQYLGVALLMPV